MSRDRIISELRGVLKSEGFISLGKRFSRSFGEIVQYIDIYKDKLDGRKYIEYTIMRGRSTLVSGRADRIFEEKRFDIISTLSDGDAYRGAFDLISWFSSEFIPILNGMTSYSGICELSYLRLDGKALIAAEIRKSW